jgi:transketolase
MSGLKATRDGFGEALVELGKTDKNVIVLSADLTASTRANWFKDKYPERFFDFGVAEQDMFSTAAGFALCGKIPFACTFGVFASGRAWDQARVSICYMNLNVKIAGTHGGISVGPDGASHQALEEVTLMRVLPNMTVIVPCDSNEARRATIAAASYPGPVYLRLGREPFPVITDPGQDFKIGDAFLLRDGRQGDRRHSYGRGAYRGRRHGERGRRAPGRKSPRPHKDGRHAGQVRRIGRAS